MSSRRSKFQLAAVILNASSKVIVCNFRGIAGCLPRGCYTCPRLIDSELRFFSDNPLIHAIFERIEWNRTCAQQLIVKGTNIESVT